MKFAFSNCKITYRSIFKSKAVTSCKADKELVREEIPIEKDEPLKLELASFVQVVKSAGKPKVGAELGKSALELAIQITDLIYSSK